MTYLACLAFGSAATRRLALFRCRFAPLRPRPAGDPGVRAGGAKVLGSEKGRQQALPSRCLPHHPSHFGTIEHPAVSQRLSQSFHSGALIEDEFSGMVVSLRQQLPHPGGQNSV